MIMLCYSFAEIAASAPIFWRSFKQVYCSIKFEYQSWSARHTGRAFTDTRGGEDVMLDDPAPAHEQVPIWAWTLGLALSICGMLIVGKLSFNMDVGIGTLALLLVFLFSFISMQASGTTDVNLVGVIAKSAQTTNPVAGSLTGIWLSAGLFVLVAEAYLYLLNLDIDCAAFGMPAVAAWRSVAIAVTAPAIITARYHVCVPNWNAIDLGFIVPWCTTPPRWSSARRPVSWEVWGSALAAGLVARVGMAGVPTTLLTVVKADGSIYGSAVACPLYTYCS